MERLYLKARTALVVFTIISLVFSPLAYLQAEQEQPPASKTDSSGQSSFFAGDGLDEKGPEYMPGELIVKLKQGKTMDDLGELNAKYKVKSIEESIIPMPQADVLKSLKDKLATLKSKNHEGWYWQMNKDSKEYKEYMADIEKDKQKIQELEGQIKGQEELVSHIEERQKRAPQTPEPVDLSNMYLLKAESDTPVSDMAGDYANHPAVESAIPNYKLKINMVPNDTYYNSPDPRQPGVKDAFYGPKASKLNCQEAWDITQGEGVIVAVIDSGVDYNHPELWDNIWVNPAIVPDTNNDGKKNLDDCDLNHNRKIDANEYIPGMFGRFFYIDSKDGSTKFRDLPNPMDDNGHGTHVAGTIAAVGNNNQGVIGVAPKAKIMPIKVLNADGSGDFWSITDGISNAVNLGADVENMSLGANLRGQKIGFIGAIMLLFMKESIKFAYDQGCVVVAAAGNDNDNMDCTIPAAIEHVITVAASDNLDQKAPFSNYGDKIDVAAPGANILSSYPTSLELPLVAYLNIASDNNKQLSSMALDKSINTSLGGLRAQLVYANLGYPADFTGKDFRGKIALIKRGIIYFSDKVKNAASAGAIGAIIFNNSSGIFSGTLVTKSSIPAAAISLEDGEYIVSLMKTGGVTANIEVVPAPDYYAVFSGTSMACPHVSGVVALILSAKPGCTVDEARAILRASADDLGTSGKDIYFGYGRVNAAKAVSIAAPLPSSAPTNVKVPLCNRGPNSYAIRATWEYPVAHEVNIDGFEYSVSAQVGTAIDDAYPGFKGKWFNLQKINRSNVLNGLQLSPGNTYYFNIRAKNKAGYSQISSVAFQTAPSAPTNLTVPICRRNELTSRYTIKADWVYPVSQEVNIDGFEYSVSAQAGTAFDDVFPGFKGKWLNTYKMNRSTGGLCGLQLSPGKTYYFNIKAKNSAGYSQISSVAFQVTALALPSAPTNVKVPLCGKRANGYTIRVAWNYPVAQEANIDSFEYSIGTEPGKADIKQYDVYSWMSSQKAGRSTIIMSLPLSAGKTYYFNIKAKNSTGYSQISSVAFQAK
ncbi:MAG: S8 family serine peptidase [Candidatus Omnitrophota bacterium]